MAYSTPLNAKKTDELGTPVTVYPQGGGQSYTGYIKNGLTYTDPHGTNRVPIGSKVNTADGKQYQLTSYGGVETYPSAINSLKKSQEDAIGGFYEARNERNAGYNAAAAAAERSYRDRVAQLERDTQLANEQARKAYIEAQNPFGVIAQRNEALGLGDSGYAESTMAALSNEYQRQLNENNRNKQDALADIYAAIEAAKSEAEFNKAMNNAATMEAITAQRAQNAESLMQHNTNAYNTGINMDNYNDEIKYARERDALLDERYKDETAYSRQQDAKNEAWNFLQNGIVNQGVADALGISLAEARAIYNTNYAPKLKPSGGGSPKKDETYTNENALFEMIKKSGEDPERWFMRNGSKYGITGDEIYTFVDAYNEWAGGGKKKITPADFGTNMSDFGPEYSSIYANVRKMREKGKSDKDIYAYINPRIENGSITEAGVVKIYANLGMLDEE